MPVPTGARAILAPDNASPALASQPDGALDDAYNTYQATPAPWWIGALWLAFFVFALVYLISNLLR
jgi:hypothetical protein